MTRKEILTLIKESAIDGTWKKELTTEDVVAFCDKEIAAIDKKAEKAREKAAQKRAEGDALTAAIKAVLSSDTFELISDITAKVDFPEVTASKVSVRLSQLFKNGEAARDEITIPGKDGQKSSKRVAYKLA